MIDQRRLMASLRDIARTLASQRSIRGLDDTLGLIVITAVDTVAAADAGGIALLEKGRMSSRTPAASPVAGLDALPSDLLEGPSVAAIVAPPRTAWFSPAILPATTLGAGCASPRKPSRPATGPCCRSSSAHRWRGAGRALNFDAGAPDSFDADDRTTARPLVLQAAMLLYGSDSAAHL